MNWDTAAVAATRRELSARADADAAAPMAAYMRDQFAFLGVSSPTRTAVWRTVRDEANAAAGGPPGRGELLRFADAMWEHDEREFQYLGALSLRWRAKVLDAADLPRVRALIESRSWWDTVDVLAPRVVGPLAQRDPDVAEAMDTWVEDDDVWVVRSAILHQLHAKQDTDVDRLAHHCRRRAHHPDFFVRKAIGWALRQYSYVDATWVESFVDAVPLSPLSRREAMKAIERRRSRQE